MATVEANCNSIVAHLPGVRNAVYDVAKKGGRRAEAILAAHRYQGHARIVVSRGAETDSFVTLDDSRGDRAAAAIEFGRSGGRFGPTQGVLAISGAFS